MMFLLSTQLTLTLTQLQGCRFNLQTHATYKGKDYRICLGFLSLGNLITHITNRVHFNDIILEYIFGAVIRIYLKHTWLPPSLLS